MQILNLLKIKPIENIKKKIVKNKFITKFPVKKEIGYIPKKKNNNFSKKLLFFDRIISFIIFKLNWLRGTDLNRRPQGYEPCELPGCSTPRFS